jgi:16S rRNA (uracil1498-N3)-methyltransferase
MDPIGLPSEYFYASPLAITGETVVIQGDEFVHLSHVMRKTRGERIMVVDGAGKAYEVSIREMAGRRAVCSVLSVHAHLHERVRAVHLGAAVLKNTASYDFLVEKCTEVGVSSITPLLTTRTIPRHSRSERWQKLALAAMKQSGRCVLPHVGGLTSLEEFLERADPDALKIIAHEKTETGDLQGFVASAGTGSPVMICVGPEGGFTDDEAEAAIRRGFHPVTLGPARLRTETAAIIATATVTGGRRSG